MSPKHNEPTYDDPRRDSKTGEKVWARAPYNFIRLPEKIVTVDLPPRQDIYSGYTGSITCEMVTRAPTYIRGMATPELIRKLAIMAKAEEERKASKRKLTPIEKEEKETQEIELKELQAPFFGLDGQPFIPGSSLRGMIRSIVEIITYSKVRWVGGEPTFSFRAVAAQNDDPLKEPYRSIMGGNGANVRAGYLHRKGNDWVIYPARTPAELGLLEKGGYLKVKERVLLESHLHGYIDLNDPNYHLQYLSVSFDTEDRKDRNNKPYTAVTRIAPCESNLRFTGSMVVCSGNMLETGRGAQRTRRKNQALVLEPAPGKEIPISRQAVEDYKLSLTPFQREELSAWGGGEWGCLKEGAPVFYVWSGREKEVVYFGHSPNFRVPVRLPGQDHASNPLDFVPLELRADELVDCADAMFGWTPEPGGKRKDSCAGRVFFSDADLLSTGADLWYSPKPIVPHVLSGPKATTFQHYLTQDRDLGHSPDFKKTLAHYGTPRTETQIRGRKWYWHKGSRPDIEANAKERKHESQLTRIQPLKEGVRFCFTIQFENLRDYELGALLWALQPHSGGNETYVHKIGMGKPLGMGAVQIERAELSLTDRTKLRYTHLFDEGNQWAEGSEPARQDFTTQYEEFILSAISGIHPNAGKAADLPPMKDLLAMMAWRGDDPGENWREWTRYMEIEYGAGKLNEFKERPVLPSPGEVLRWISGNPSSTAETGSHASSPPAERPIQIVPEPFQPAWPPKKGAVLFGKVLDVEPHGKVYLSITRADDAASNSWLRKNGDEVEIVGVIQPKHISGKSYREGSGEIRLIVVSAQEDASGWLIECRPAN
jgi:CRISPR-associated protein (TIGR03986 family)